MSDLYLNGRVVLEAEVTGVDMVDYPDFCDCYFESATFEDGTKLSIDELEQLSRENPDVLNELAHYFIH